MSRIVTSTREAIVLKVKSELEGISGIQQVVRRQPYYEDLMEFPQNMFPMIAMHTRLPVPDAKESARFQGKIDLVQSELVIEMYCYMLDNATVDTSISTYTAAIWNAVLADPTHGGIVLRTEIRPEGKPQFWPPYGALHMNAHLWYWHTTGGI